jgi:apolipoprotein N-acyltransferase
MIDQHEDLAEATGWVFLSLTAIFAAMCYGLVLLQKRGQFTIARYLPIIYVVLYTAGAVLLIQTAHRGGLVHQFGVHATMPGGISSTASLD